MTKFGDKQRQHEIPIGIDAWERTLVRHFLAIGPDGDASDIRAIEVSPTTLAIACGVHASFEAEVENAFRNALLRDQNHLFAALKEGSRRRPSKDIPNCFAPLAMTLLIDSLLGDEGYETNQFRVKLASWLGVDSAFNDLAGVKLMWEELASWLNAEASAGRPFRRIVLPDHPKNWVHIGYTRRLSFPNRADVRTVERVLSSTSEKDLANPTVVINAFWNCSSHNTMSNGLKEAFKDFEQAYYSQRRALADHRFWVLINRVRAVAGPKSAPLAHLEIGFTADDEREFRVTFDGDDGIRTYQSLAVALADQYIRNSPNLGASASRGLFIFKQTGMARWTAEPNMGKCGGRVLIAYHDKMAPQMRGRLRQVVQYENWRLTIDPINADKLGTELAHCGFKADDVALFRPAASDGVRVNGAWLGLPGFLPLIASDTNDIRILPSTGAAGQCISVADGFRLSAERPACGSYVIEPKPAPGERGPHWRLKLQFVDRAAPHFELVGARKRHPQLVDWSVVRASKAVCSVPHSFEWGRADDALEWLLEALYASGASGWDECHIVDFLRRSDAEAAEAPWRTLRMLQDGGVIEPRLRQGWKGRTWTLAAPRIVRLDSSAGPIALAEGAFCAQMLDAFAIASKAMGATPFREPGAARWTVPVMGAAGGDPEQLARILQWEYVAQPAAPANNPLALAVTERRADHYLTAAAWCWRSRRFVSAVDTQRSVRLTLLSHRAGTDHDVYRVESNGARSHFLSRSAAIIAAHAAASVPLFAFDGAGLSVTGRDGALPDALCAALRRRRLANGGFGDGVYVYPATVEDASWIAALLPRCVSGLGVDVALAPAEVLSRSRRSNSALRPRWINGHLKL